MVSQFEFSECFFLAQVKSEPELFRSLSPNSIIFISCREFHRRAASSSFAMRSKLSAATSFSCSIQTAPFLHLGLMHSVSVSGHRKLRDKLCLPCEAYR